MSIVSNALQTTETKLMGPNKLGSVVLGGFATGATITRRQSLWICEVWGWRLKRQDNAGAIKVV